MSGGIYRIRNTLNGRFYIGSTKSFYNRFKSHQSILRLDKHFNAYLQNDYNKCGVEYFVYEIVEIMDELENRTEVEKCYLEELYDGKDLCYNIVKDPTQNLFIQASEETRKKMSDNLKRKWEDKECRDKMLEKIRLNGLKQRGKIVSQETRDKLSLAATGKPNGAKGKLGKESLTYKIYNVRILSPDGEVFGPIVCAAEFCREHGLDKSNFYHLLHGEWKTCYGWTFIEFIDKSVAEILPHE